MSKFSSTLMTEAPLSRAEMAAARPETPAPMITTSADRSHLIGVFATWAPASWAPAPAKAAAPTPAALFERKARRLTDFAPLPGR